MRLGFDPVLDRTRVHCGSVGSGGTTEKVPGFFVDQLTIQAVGGSITLDNVPVIVLDVVNPAHPGNIVDGIVGMNLLAGRNVVIDPKPSTGGGGVGPSLYIGDPVTTQKNWTIARRAARWQPAVIGTVAPRRRRSALPTCGTFPAEIKLPSSLPTRPSGN